MKIKYDANANLYVVEAVGFALECFDTEQAAADYLAEFEATAPKTAGQTMSLAKKHGALFRRD